MLTYRNRAKGNLIQANRAEQTFPEGREPGRLALVTPDVDLLID